MFCHRSLLVCAVTLLLVWAPDATAQFGGMGGGMGGGGMGGGGIVTNKPWKIAKPDSEVADAVFEALDLTTELGQIDTKLSDLGHLLTEKLDGLPVFVDQRGIKIAELSPNAEIEANIKSLPLRSALRELLEPHALHAIVENEGLLITADFVALTRRGIATDRWIGMDREFVHRIEKVLDAPFAADFVEVPLEQVRQSISQAVGLPLTIDRRALEEIGLSSDQPVTLVLKDVPLRAVLNLMLKELDLTYMTRDSVVTITTIEASEQQLQNRIYWLEGLGTPKGDFDSLMSAVQTTIVPDTWEALGGPSTMSPVTSGDGNRPALLISTVYPIHDQIEKLFAALRETHVGVDPVGLPPEKKPGKVTPPEVANVGGAF